MTQTTQFDRQMILMGASLNTGNLGVSALLASTVEGLLEAHPGARLWLLDGGRTGEAERVRMPDGSSVELGRVGVRFNKTLWRPNHIVRLLLTELGLRLAPTSAWRQRLRRSNPCLRALCEARMAADITGGDSFSDLYGMRRLIFGFLRKWLVLLSGTDLVLLPQTYGPFRRRLSRAMARFVLARAAAVYARDEKSLEEIRKLMGRRKMRAVPQLCPDVAFTLSARRPDSPQARQVEQLRSQGRPPVGLNVSGLLYHGGYTGDNMFGLACDYASLIHELLVYFVRQEDRTVLLAPHVIPADFPVENDWEACRAVCEALPADVRERVIVLDGGYDQHQMKYFIGLCDFFMGSRMHSTIAALSQCVPAAGMAYSRKFAGVFETVGVERAVVDLRRLSGEEALGQIRDLYRDRTGLKSQLQERMPAVREQINTLFRNLP